MKSIFQIHLPLYGMSFFKYSAPFGYVQRFQLWVSLEEDCRLFVFVCNLEFLAGEYF